MLEGSHVNSRIEYAQMSLGISKSPVKGKGGAEQLINLIPKAESENHTKRSKKDLISALFFVINTGN
jgi:hypothetical protein